MRLAYPAEAQTDHRPAARAEASVGGVPASGGRHRRPGWHPGLYERGARHVATRGAWRRGGLPVRTRRDAIQGGGGGLQTPVLLQQRLQLAQPVGDLFVLLPGRPGALLRLAPLRTGRARFRASGSSKPWRLTGGQKCWPVVITGGVLVMAVGVYETGFGLFRRVVLPYGDLGDRLAGGGLPLLPLAWG